MKILHICTGFPLSFQGGITNYVRALAKKQYENGNLVWVMGSKDEERYDFNYYTYTSFIRNFTVGRLDDKFALYKLKKFLEKEKFDIIHIHLVLKMDWDLYKILKEYKYIVSLHDYYFLCPRIDMVQEKGQVCQSYDERKCKNCISYLERLGVCRVLFRKYTKYTKKEKKMLYLPQEITKIRHKKFKKLLEGADCLLPVSNRVKEIFEESKIQGNYKVLHIGNISADNYVKEYQYCKNSHKIKLAFIGRLSYNKGSELLFKIAEKIDRNKYEIHFYGRDEGHTEDLKKYHIINNGPYQQSDLCDILKDIDMGMVLSVWEDNGPQVVMEFLNNHVPVIGTKMGGIYDFVNEGNGYLFNPFSKEEFNELLRFLEKLSIEDIARLKRNISPTTTTVQHYNALMSVYKEVIKN